MNLGIENKKKAIAAVSLVALLLLATAYQLGCFSSAPPAPPPAAPVIKTLSTTDTHAPAASPTGKPAEPIAYSAAQLDPTLRMEGMLDAESLVYGGSGRNIFSTQSAPPPIPKAIAPARPTAPLPPPVYVPPPPPPINLTFFGIETQKNGSKRAFLVHGDDVFLAAPGDIVERRYKIDSILTNGVVIEDLPNNNTQTIPLVQ